MSAVLWFVGEPPSHGWWPASASQDEDLFRWWNGKHWSWGCAGSCDKMKAQLIATLPAESIGIKWAERPASWPDRSFA